MAPTLTERLDAILPQTQCTRCGYAGCRPYAEALASGSAPPDRCPPGGTPVAEALAAALGVPAMPIDPSVGAEGPPRVAVIDETVCIGCAKCLPACPVDAIVGARKRLHTVVAADCSGCELCLPPCPVDCITLVTLDAPPLDGTVLMQRAAHYRSRFEAHGRRENARETERRARLAARSPVGESI
jgi:Na+-translocating ferredoxin:NAD+ oxidoreductase subunit B